MGPKYSVTLPRHFNIIRNMNYNELNFQGLQTERQWDIC